MTVIGTILIQNQATATLIIPSGETPHLVQNGGSNNLYIGDNNAINWEDATILIIPPNGSFASDGSQAVYATAAPNLPTVANVLAGGTSFFQPVSSITIPTGATTGERIVINGTTGEVTIYNSSNNIERVISPVGDFFYSGNPSELLMSMVPATAFDPVNNISCPEGFTNFRPGQAYVYVNINNLSITVAQGQTATQSIISFPEAGTVLIQSGDASGGNQAIILVQSSDASGGEGEARVNIEVPSGNLQVNGTDMTVP
jgi:hypothetical protein